MAPYVAGAEFAGYWVFNASDHDASASHNLQAAAAFKAVFGPAPVVSAALPPPIASMSGKISAKASVAVLPHAEGLAVLALASPRRARV